MELTKVISPFLHKHTLNLCTFLVGRIYPQASAVQCVTVVCRREGAENRLHDRTRVQSEVMDGLIDGERSHHYFLSDFC